MDKREFTVRLPEDQARELEVVARADGVSVAQAIRDAVLRHVEERRRDDTFQHRLTEMMREDQEILERLAR